MTGSVRRAVAAGVVAIAFLGACGGDDDGGGGDDETAAEVQSGSTETSGEASASASPEAAVDAEPVTHHLEAADQAYAEGDTGGARAHFAEAVAAWDQLSSSLPEPSAAQVQNLLDALDGQLEGSAPASEVTALIGQISLQLNQPSGG